MNVARIALPGYNAQLDTNPDHFSLYADVDNVLIKRKTTGTATLSASGGASPTILTVPHNLGYIPFFMVHIDQNSDGKYSILNNQYNLFSPPAQIASADTTNLYIYNYETTTRNVAYDIFYDQMATGTNPSIKENQEVFKVARPGKDARSTNPNDFIMHSDLNNFKLLKEGIVHTDIASLSSFSFAHGAQVQSPYKYFLFIVDDEDGIASIMGGTTEIKAYDEGMTLLTSSMDNTNIYITFPTQGAGAEAITIKYYIYGSGKDNTVPRQNYEVAVTAPGKNVLKETNPDSFNFHSAYSTLKYFVSDTFTMTVTSTTTHTIAHNLGYTPFFIVFVSDLNQTITGGYALCPYYLSRSTIGNTNRDVAAFAYADSTNIYLKAWYQPNAVGTSFTFTFYYKIFKNNMGL